LYIVSDLTAARHEEESAVLLKRILSVLEPMVQANPENRLYRDTLIRTYRAAVPTFLGLGDFAASLDFELKGVKLEAPPVSPKEFYSRGLRLGRAASLELQLGHGEMAQERWRESLAQFQQAARASEQQWSADSQNLSALETLRLAEGAAAFTLEELGDLPGALRLRESGYGHAVALWKADPGTAGNRDRWRASRADAVRGLWLIAAEGGDYGRFFEKGSPAREQLRADLAYGWRVRAEFIDNFGSSLPWRVEAATNSVALSRQLVATTPSITNRLELARSLLTAGDAIRAAKALSHATEQGAAYLHSRDAYQEGVKILNSLKDSGELPMAGNADLMTLTNNLADAEERLRESRNQHAVSRN
jgi:hypothetical protein